MRVDEQKAPDFLAGLKAVAESRVVALSAIAASGNFAAADSLMHELALFSAVLRKLEFLTESSTAEVLDGCETLFTDFDKLSPQPSADYLEFKRQFGLVKDKIAEQEASRNLLKVKLLNEQFQWFGVPVSEKIKKKLRALLAQLTLPQIFPVLSFVEQLEQKMRFDKFDSLGFFLVKLFTTRLDVCNESGTFDLSLFELLCLGESQNKQVFSIENRKMYEDIRKLFAETRNSIWFEKILRVLIKDRSFRAHEIRSSEVPSLDGFEAYLEDKIEELRNQARLDQGLIADCVLLLTRVARFVEEKTQVQNVNKLLGLDPYDNHTKLELLVIQRVGLPASFEHQPISFEDFQAGFAIRFEEAQELQATVRFGFR